MQTVRCIRIIFSLYLSLFSIDKLIQTNNDYQNIKMETNFLDFTHINSYKSNDLFILKFSVMLVTFVFFIMTVLQIIKFLFNSERVDILIHKILGYSIMWFAICVFSFVLWWTNFSLNLFFDAIFTSNDRLPFIITIILSTMFVHDVVVLLFF